MRIKGRKNMNDELINSAVVGFVTALMILGPILVIGWIFSKIKAAVKKRKTKTGG